MLFIAAICIVFFCVYLMPVDLCNISALVGAVVLSFLSCLQAVDTSNNNNNNNNKLTFQKNAQLTKIVTQAPVMTRKPSLWTEQKSLKWTFEMVHRHRWMTQLRRQSQASGPAVENARGPYVTVCVLGRRSWLSSAERSREQPETEAVGTHSLER